MPVSITPFLTAKQGRTYSRQSNVTQQGEKSGEYEHDDPSPFRPGRVSVENLFGKLGGEKEAEAQREYGAKEHGYWPLE